MQERRQGDLIPEGWSFTRASRVYVRFRQGDMIATLIADIEEDPSTWVTEISHRPEESHGS